MHEHIREHMEVIGADGVHLGTVDHVEGQRIKLTKADSGVGSHSGHHHFISLALVADIEGDRVRLTANADVAFAMEEEEGGEAAERQPWGNDDEEAESGYSGQLGQDQGYDDSGRAGDESQLGRGEAPLIDDSGRA